MFEVIQRYFTLAYEWLHLGCLLGHWWLCEWLAFASSCRVHVQLVSVYLGEQLADCLWVRSLLSTFWDAFVSCGLSLNYKKHCSVCRSSICSQKYSILLAQFWFWDVCLYPQKCAVFSTPYLFATVPDCTLIAWQHPQNWMPRTPITSSCATTYLCFSLSSIWYWIYLLGFCESFPTPRFACLVVW